MYVGIVCFNPFFTRISINDLFTHSHFLTFWSFPLAALSTSSYIFDSFNECIHFMKYISNPNLLCPLDAVACLQLLYMYLQGVVVS